MRKTTVLFILLSAFVAAPAIAKERTPPPPQPATEPDWAQVRIDSEGAIKAALIDPGSAQIAWTHGFRWGFWKPVLQKKQWGWVGCGTVNARNRMGGYAGTSAFVIVYDNGVKYSGIDSNDWPLIAGSCQSGGFPALQTAFLDAPTTPKGPVSIADELTKLAELRDKGVITQAEFDAEKKKLLDQ